MIGSSANSFQINNDAGAKAAQIARTQNTEKTEVNRVAVENKVENRVESDVKREEAGKSAAEQMKKENNAITFKPEDGIELEISKKGLQAEQDDRRKAVNDKDEKSDVEQRLEEQQKVRARIKEQVQKELDEEKQENKTSSRREEVKADREQFREKAAENDEENKQAITNFAGYTEAQLKQMAQNGEISQNDYNKEIEKREEQTTQTQQSLQATDRELASNVGKLDKVDRQSAAVQDIFDEDSNQNINEQTRADIVQSLENPQNTAVRREDDQRDQQQRAFNQWQNDFGFLIR